MNLQDPVHVFCMLLGIAPEDLTEPCRILGIDPAERESGRIEEAFRACLRHVQTVQHHVMPAHWQWMMQVVHHARAAVIQRAAMTPSPARTVQSASMPAWMPGPAFHGHSRHAASATSEPPVIVHAHQPPCRRGGFLGNLASAVGALVMCGMILAGVGWFVRQSWEDLGGKTGRVAGARQGPRKAAVRSTAVGTGGRKPGTPEVVPAAPAPGEGGGAPAGAADVADARQQLEKAVELARQGSFEEALRLTQRASKALPEQSEGLELIIEYSRQYTQLAEQARRSINGNQEVNLGPPYGNGQFVEQDADEITFFIRGKHKRFTIHQFNGLKGVRFRVTRDYLDQAHNPANELVLGSCHFLMRINDTGEQAAESDGLREAERRFGNALASGDAACVEHATRMRSAIHSLCVPPVR